MHVEATTAAPLETGADTIVVGLIGAEGVPHDTSAGELSGLLERGEARSAPGALALTHVDGRRFVLVGLGEREQLDGERAREAAAAVGGRVRELGSQTVCWEVPHHVGDEVVGGLVEGTLLHAYRFERFKPPAEERFVQRLILSAHHDVSARVREAEVVTRAQNRARDLANMPANELPPAALADYAVEVRGVEVEVMDGEAIRAAGMGALAAVAQGSHQDPRVIVIEYRGAAAQGAPRLGLVGKAVTFDSGGLSLKPAAAMHEMKFDMAGGAAVLEAVAALAELEAPVDVVGVIGATENLPGGGAIKPGDVVTALDGTTIEVNNTDAEGRLVLADCFTLIRRRGCDQLVDVATLTGAIVTALGSTHAGLMSNDDALAARLEDCGRRTGELLWRLPLHRDYAEMVKGRYAQLTNKSERREAASITAAEFLHHFAGELPWAHLDVAGTAYDVRKSYFVGKGATGWGVRLLVELARSRASG